MAHRFVPRRRIAALAAAACAASAEAQPWSYTRIADSNTLIPGTSSTFDTFNLPSIRGNVVGFAGFLDGLSEAGVYTGSGGALTVVADRHTPGPGGPNFIGFFQATGVWPSIDVGLVAFHAGNGVHGGIMLNSGGAITPVGTTGITVPNGTGGSFQTTSSPSLQNGRVAFAGGESGSGQRGVYSWQSGALSIIADKTTPIPGGPGTFTNFFEAALDGGQVMFQGSGAGGYNGLFLADKSGGITRLYDTNTPIPGATGSFSGLSQSAFSDGRVVFYGQGSMEGIYSDVSGQLEVIANHNTLVPGFPGLTFSGFGNSAIDGGVVAFTGLAPGGFLGVFSTHGGSLGKVLANGDMLDGRIVEDAFIGGQTLDGASIAISVVFTNGSRGIYMATIPAPGPLALGIGAALAFAIRRRR
ncbi:MAG: hypothetical protein ACKVU4_00555 [Phycisphaerales bacterium]